jgi:hypothetical protein
VYVIDDRHVHQANGHGHGMLQIRDVVRDIV